MARTKKATTTTTPGPVAAVVKRTRPPVAASIVHERLHHRRNAIAIRWRTVTEPALLAISDGKLDDNWFVALTRVLRQMAALDRAMSRTGHTI